MRHSKQFARKVKFLSTMHSYCKQFLGTFDALELAVNHRQRKTSIDAHIIEQFLAMTDHPPDVEAQRRAEAKALERKEKEREDREEERKETLSY